MLEFQSKSIVESKSTEDFFPVDVEDCVDAAPVDFSFPVDMLTPVTLSPYP